MNVLPRVHPGPCVYDNQIIYSKWWELLLARIFGRHVQVSDDECLVTGYLWGERMYITGIVHNENL